MGKVVIGFIPHFPYEKWVGCQKVTKELAADIATYSALSVVERASWGRHEGHITPVFVLKRGRELAKYIMDWSLGKPNKFFKFYAISCKDKYALILHPHLEDAAGKVYCSPIRFVSSDMSMFRRVRFTNKTYLGFLDSSDIKNNEIPSLGGHNYDHDRYETPAPDVLGPFDVGSPERLSLYAKKIFS